MRRLGVRRTDLVLPVVIVALGLAELASLDIDRRGVAAAFLVVNCAALVLRRRWPLVVGTAVGVAETSVPWIGPAYDEAATGILVILAAIYALGRWLPDLRGLAGLGVILLVTLATYLGPDARDHGLSDVVFVAALVLPPYVVGRITRRLAVQAEQLRAQQAALTELAVRDERDRIARELHDVIAHSISAMVVQAGAAQDLLRRDPARSEELLASVAATGRRALSETGRLLHLIRDRDDELGLVPTPGIADLEDLVAEFRRDGLGVELVTDGTTAGGSALPAAVDVSAYRILREALTNALRYSADRRARVEVSAGPAALALRVVNRSTGATGRGSGLGLVGVAERVELLGGTLRTGPTADGRYELCATLPLVRDDA